MSLLAAFIAGDSSECLQKTCEYLRRGATDNLEMEWIAMSSIIGVKLSGPSGKAMNDVNTELIRLLEANKIRVKEALVLTSKLCLLNGRHSSTPPIESMRALKPKIYQYIPETAKLAYAGITMFASILPSQEEPEYIFFSRVLAALGKLVDDGDIDALRTCLEYISRKKLILKTPDVWPAPAATFNGDPDWFLWGFLLCFFKDTPDYANVATNWKVYTWRWKKGCKVERQGLLWCSPYCLVNKSMHDFVWSKEELSVLEQVRNMALDLWKESEEAPPQAFDFTPRGYSQVCDYSVDDLYNYQGTKVISIHERKKV